MIKQAVSKIIAERTLNIASILKNVKSLIKEAYQKGCSHKFNNKKYQNTYFRAEIAGRYEKLLTLKEKMQMDF